MSASPRARLARARARACLSAASGAGLAGLVVLAAACAQGTPSFDLGEAGTLPDDGATERSPLPTRDGAASETGAEGGPGDDAGPCTRRVVINELKVEGATADEEFVELYNAGTCAVPLGGWALKYQASTGNAGLAGYTFQTGDSIPAKGYLVIATDSFSGAKNATLTGGFAKAAGQVGLLDDTGVVVDGVGYGSLTGGTFKEGASATAPPASGSIARTSDGVDTDDNAADFAVSTPHSAGAAN